eukprot:353947-Chlamydomonas_euryale.AAC.5
MIWHGTHAQDVARHGIACDKAWSSVTWHGMSWHVAWHVMARCMACHGTLHGMAHCMELHVTMNGMAWHGTLHGMARDKAWHCMARCMALHWVACERMRSMQHGKTPHG